MTTLIIEEKCREMMMYGYQAIKQFPKHERHVLGAEIRLSMLQLQRLIITAFKRYHKKTTLTDLDIELAILKRRVRLAKDLRYIDIKRYEIWVGQLVELGKMIGGWIRSVNAKQQGVAL
ncbi:diversity-generating retroelement protein bAvd family protein [Vibrio parahaemolyticus]|uniref:diversity-generating retroelement protein Avd n=2 Tax=Gammaproteobacteria TaxID=1236 RepID=UPI0011227F9A|nr:diversity-generating retroelement protein Avd [Vibrio parahaemolyticus]TOE71986.1 diversity-generating retroelement protein bAvd family protein [Vibrio parahaemolyticus]